MNLIFLARDREKWTARVDTAINFRAPYNLANFEQLYHWWFPKKGIAEWSWLVWDNIWLYIIWVTN
jgi:hypothetical protein